MGDENYSICLFIQFFTWWRSIHMLFLYQKQNYVVSLRTTSHEAKFPLSPCLKYGGWKTQACVLVTTGTCTHVYACLRFIKAPRSGSQCHMDEEPALGSVTTVSNTHCSACPFMHLGSSCCYLSSPNSQLWPFQNTTSCYKAFPSSKYVTPFFLMLNCFLVFGH